MDKSNSGTRKFYIPVPCVKNVIWAVISSVIGYICMWRGAYENTNIFLIIPCVILCIASLSLSALIEYIFTTYIANENHMRLIRPEGYLYYVVEYPRNIWKMSMGLWLLSDAIRASIIIITPLVIAYCTNNEILKFLTATMAAYQFISFNEASIECK